ncbi:RILP-like protein, partial [Leptotrombidium deliense]
MLQTEDQLESTVDDVYDLAAAIGKEFEAIIDVYGSEVISKLMPKVISVLERLEFSSMQTDTQRAHMTSLQSKIAELEKAKLSSTENRMKFEVEMEQIEEFWRKENNTLSNMLKRLKDDNDRLHSELKLDTDIPCNCGNRWFRKIVFYSLFVSQNVLNIQEEFTVANQQIQDLNKLLRYLQLENNSLHEQNQDLKSKLEQQNCDMIILKEKLQKTMTENMDLMSQSSDSRSKASDMPKFSLLEFRNILIERNSLKSELHELKSELSARKSNQELRVSQNDVIPVQGPINREPEEKLFPDRKRNTILK